MILFVRDPSGGCSKRTPRAVEGRRGERKKGRWRILLRREGTRRSLGWEREKEREILSEMVSDCGRTERCYIQIRVDDGMRGGESRRVVVVSVVGRTRCVYGRFACTQRGKHEDLRTVDRIQNSGRLPSPRAVMRSCPSTTTGSHRAPSPSGISIHSYI